MRLAMKKYIIDTDTASDDAVALIMALKEPSIRVEAITVVAGNLPIELALKNALISVETANTYFPPVYQGMAKPLLKELYTSEFVHGADGMGNMDLPDPKIIPEKEHAVDALIRIVEENSDQLELITLGPLTNIAMACLKAPDTMRKLKGITIMGGAGLGPGNITPVAEFNIYVDAEAANVVFNSKIPIFLVGWDVSMETTFINVRDIEALLKSGSRIAEFCIRCNRSLQEFNLQRMNKHGFDLPDPVTMAAALYPDTVCETFDAYAYVEYKSESAYGQVIIDYMNILGKQTNIKVCKSLDGNKFKEHLFQLLI
jgi:purine nucleosidase